MSNRRHHGWKTTSRRDRVFALAAVAAVHLGILLLLLTVGSARLQRLAEQPLQLITLPSPARPLPPARAKPIPQPAAAARRATAATKPRPTPRRILPSPAPVEVAAAADITVSATVGSGVSLGSIGSGFGSGDGAASGGLSRHAEWIGGAIANRDYPEAAKRAGLQGVVDVRVIVMTDGRVRNCQVDHSSGSVELDRMTCVLVEQRLLFSPALDASGKPVEEVSGRRFRYVATRRSR